jgi:hypothetical protein
VAARRFVQCPTRRPGTAVIASRSKVSLLSPIGLAAVPNAIDGDYLASIVYVVDYPVFADPHAITLHGGELSSTWRTGIPG